MEYNVDPSSRLECSNRVSVVAIASIVSVLMSCLVVYVMSWLPIRILTAPVVIIFAEWSSIFFPKTRRRQIK